MFSGTTNKKVLGRCERDQAQAKTALHQSEERYRLLAEQVANNFIWKSTKNSNRKSFRKNIRKRPTLAVLTRSGVC